MAQGENKSVFQLINEKAEERSRTTGRIARRSAPILPSVTQRNTSAVEKHTGLYPESPQFVAAVGRLSEVQREVIQLAQQGLSEAEIGKRLGKTRIWVGQQLSRAKTLVDYYMKTQDP